MAKRASSDQLLTAWANFSMLRKQSLADEAAARIMVRTADTGLEDLWNTIKGQSFRFKGYAALLLFNANPTPQPQRLRYVLPEDSLMTVGGVTRQYKINQQRLAMVALVPEESEPIERYIAYLHEAVPLPQDIDD